MESGKDVAVDKLKIIKRLGNYQKKTKQRHLDLKSMFKSIGIEDKQGKTKKEDDEVDAEKMLETLKFRLKQQRRRIQKEIKQSDKEMSRKPSLDKKESVPLIKEEKTRKLSKEEQTPLKNDNKMKIEEPKVVKEKTMVIEHKEDNKDGYSLFSNFQEKMNTTYSIMFSPLECKETILLKYLKKMKRYMKIDKPKKLNECIKEFVDKYSFYSRGKIDVDDLVLILENLHEQ